MSTPGRLMRRVRGNMRVWTWAAAARLRRILGECAGSVGAWRARQYVALPPCPECTYE